TTGGESPVFDRRVEAVTGLGVEHGGGGAARRPAEAAHAPPQVVPHRGGLDLGDEASLALSLELADAQAAVDHDRLAQPHRLGDVVAEPAPAADGEEGLVAVTPFLELLVEV